MNDNIEGQNVILEGETKIGQHDDLRCCSASRATLTWYDYPCERRYQGGNHYNSESAALFTLSPVEVRRQSLYAQLGDVLCGSGNAVEEANNWKGPHPPEGGKDLVTYLPYIHHTRLDPVVDVRAGHRERAPAGLDRQKASKEQLDLMTPTGCLVRAACALAVSLAE